MERLKRWRGGGVSSKDGGSHGSMRRTDWCEADWTTADHSNTSQELADWLLNVPIFYSWYRGSKPAETARKQAPKVSDRKSKTDLKETRTAVKYVGADHNNEWKGSEAGQPEQLRESQCDATVHPELLSRFCIMSLIIVVLYIEPILIYSRPSAFGYNLNYIHF